MKRWASSTLAMVTLALAGAFACGTDESAANGQDHVPPPRYSVGRGATAIVPDARGRAEVVLPAGEVLLAFLPSTQEKGSYRFSVFGVEATVPTPGLAVSSLVERAVSAITTAVEKAVTPEEVANFKPNAMVASALVPSAATFPEERRFSAPAGRNKKGFVSVDAVKVAEGDRVVFYAEETNPMVEEIAQPLVEYFDRVVFPEETLLFGAVPDTDNNGKVIMLATAAVNTYSNEPGQFTGGFFASKDLDGREGSNRADMLYLYLPRPTSEGGVFNHAEDYFHLAQEVIVHEMQHMINYAARLSRGTRLETAWLNEGLSHWAEEHFGFHRSNRIRSRQFLNSPATTPLVGMCSSLAERGAAYLFVKYLVEKSGDPVILRKLVSTGLRGTDNIEAATGKAFTAVLRDWTGHLLVNYGDVLGLTKLEGKTLNAEAPQSAATVLRVRGPGVLKLQASPTGVFQGVGYALDYPAEVTTASSSTM